MHDILGTDTIDPMTFSRLAEFQMAEAEELLYSNGEFGTSGSNALSGGLAINCHFNCDP